MIGLGLALIYFYWQHFVSGIVLEAAYFFTTWYLSLWYVFWFLILGICMTVTYILIAIIGGAAEAEKAKGRVGGLVLGLFIGRSLSLINAFVFVIRRIIYVAGAYFLHHALIIRGNPHEYQWSVNHLAFGCLLLGIATFVRRKKRIWRSQPLF